MIYDVLSVGVVTSVHKVASPGHLGTSIVSVGPWRFAIRLKGRVRQGDTISYSLARDEAFSMRPARTRPWEVVNLLVARHLTTSEPQAGDGRPGCA